MHTKAFSKAATKRNRERGGQPHKKLLDEKDNLAGNLEPMELNEGGDECSSVSSHLLVSNKDMSDECIDVNL